MACVSRVPSTCRLRSTTCMPSMRASKTVPSSEANESMGDKVLDKKTQKTPPKIPQKKPKKTTQHNPTTQPLPTRTQLLPNLVSASRFWNTGLWEWRWGNEKRAVSQSRKRVKAFGGASCGCIPRREDERACEGFHFLERHCRVEAPETEGGDLLHALRACRSQQKVNAESTLSQRGVNAESTRSQRKSTRTVFTARRCAFAFVGERVAHLRFWWGGFG